jgi:hypothetical protein
MIVGMNNYCFFERLGHFTLWNGDVVFSVRYEVNLNGPVNVCCNRPYSAVSRELISKASALWNAILHSSEPTAGVVVYAIWNIAVILGLCTVC